MNYIKHLIVLCILTLTYLNASTTGCDRKAIINYQKVAVDTSSTQKGEGLRFHLEKDPKALDLLDLYQNESKIKWQNAVLGTVGTSLILGGFITNNNSKQKNTFLISGALFLAFNFLVARTFYHDNERYLFKSVEEYNKRNTPKIELLFSPDGEENAKQFYINLNKDF